MGGLRGELIGEVGGRGEVGEVISGVGGKRGKWEELIGGVEVGKR